MLTKRQQAVLQTIKAHHDKYGEAPTPKQIATALGYKASNYITEMISALVAYGCVERLGKCGNHRTIGFVSMTPIKYNSEQKSLGMRPLPELTEAQKRAWFREVMEYNKLI